MSANASELIVDELELMRRLLPLSGAKVIDLGCGMAEMPRRLLRDALVASVTGLEVDKVQHARNLAATPVAGLDFVFAGADDIPFGASSFNIAMMFKSLHHVPLDRLDRALTEIERVLAPGGVLYVSEPVFAGEFNEIVRLFNDEEIVRKAAYAALERAISAGLMEAVAEKRFDTPLAFRDFDDFFQRVVKATHSDRTLVGERLAEVRRRFERHATPLGVRFVRPMRVNLLRKRS
jgi:ubiquinone/menaquinone biosynthesis C-methylase UbiE